MTVARESRRRSCTRPGVWDTAISETALARSTPIWVPFTWAPPPGVGLRGRWVVLARWCRSGEESIPSLAAVQALSASAGARYLPTAASRRTPQGLAAEAQPVRLLRPTPATRVDGRDRKSVVRAR